jgi:hypothetical protein
VPVLVPVGVVCGSALHVFQRIFLYCEFLPTFARACTHPTVCVLHVSMLCIEFHVPQHMACEKTLRWCLHFHSFVCKEKNNNAGSENYSPHEVKGKHSPHLFVCGK